MRWHILFAFKFFPDSINSKIPEVLKLSVTRFASLSSLLRCYKASHEGKRKKLKVITTHFSQMEKRVLWRTRPGVWWRATILFSSGLTIVLGTWRQKASMIFAAYTGLVHKDARRMVTLTLPSSSQQHVPLNARWPHAPDTHEVFLPVVKYTSSGIHHLTHF